MDIKKRISILLDVINIGINDDSAHASEFNGPGTENMAEWYNGRVSIANFIARELTNILESTEDGQ